jgi:ATP-binding cassette subfamily B multidrug efflux pump
MLRLFKFLRPYAGLIILIFALLFAQAMTDLALPDYMSKIVNTGIQQDGIENVLPEAVLASHMDKLALLMSSEDIAALQKYYKLLNKDELSADEFANQVKIYPKLADEGIFVLTDRNAVLPGELEKTLSRALLMLEGISSGKAAAFLGNVPERIFSRFWPACRIYSEKRRWTSFSKMFL